MKRAVVTGAASGIGRALTDLLVGEGFGVVAVDVSPQEPRSPAIRAVTADVAVSEDMSRVAEDAGDADLVCLNAGIVGASLGAPWETSQAEWERVLGVNLLGVVNGLRAFVPKLLSAGRTSHILITASLAGLVTFPMGGAYPASKHAVVVVAEQTALALADSPVGVTVMCPSLVRSGMSAEGADPVDVARAALDACREGTFCVIEAEWAPAVEARSHRLAAGTAPEIPAPAPPSGDSRPLQ